LIVGLDPEPLGGKSDVVGLEGNGKIATDADGWAKMPHLKPGRYRVWRYWRPSPAKKGAGQPDPLSWRNGRVVADIRDKMVDEYVLGTFNS
jgi:hypothetical protein